MEISIRFAIDANRDHKVQPEEVIRNIQDLASQDREGDGVLKGRDLDDVFYEYGKDVWVPAGRPQRVKSDGFECILELRSLDYRTGKIDLNVSCYPS